MTFAILAAVVQATWLVVEWQPRYVTIEKPWQQQASDTSGKNWDRHSSTDWDVANAVEPVGLLLAFLGVGRFVAHNCFIGLVGFASLVLGISIRWTAIRTLGRLFTGVVMMYRYVRPTRMRYIVAIGGHLGPSDSPASCSGFGRMTAIRKLGQAGQRSACDPCCPEIAELNLREPRI